MQSLIQYQKFRVVRTGHEQKYEKYGKLNNNNSLGLVDNYLKTTLAEDRRYLIKYS